MARVRAGVRLGLWLPRNSIVVRVRIRIGIRIRIRIGIRIRIRIRIVIGIGVRIRIRIKIMKTPKHLKTHLNSIEILKGGHLQTV